VAWGDYIACDTFDMRERLTAIRVPTLVVCGREDRMTPVKYSEFLAQRIPQAELSVIEQAGHMVMLEQPAAFNAALGDWLGTQRFTEK
jgi:pimeloyl-ACP methyl ester carboxylesterase